MKRIHRRLLVLLLAAPLWAALACEDLTLPGDTAGEPPVRSVEGVTTAVAAIVGTFAEGPLDEAFLLESFDEFERYYGGTDSGHEASFHVRAFFDNGGERIWVVRASSATTDALLGDAGTGGGLEALDGADRFDLLLVPELFTAAAISGRAEAAAQAVDYAAARDAFMLLDPPADAESARDVSDWVEDAAALLRRREAALYFGRLEVPGDSGAATSRMIGASGAAAGLYARSDRQRGVWSAPAGPEVPLQGVLAVSPLTSAEQEALTAANVNPVVALAGGGHALWGGRTLSSDPAFRYIHVQRLTLHVEARVREQLEWAAGGSSGPELWSQARGDVEDILRDLWSEGAFQGATPEEAYFVRCDQDTHTSEDLAANRLVLQAGFAALTPAEFVVRTIMIDL